MDPITAGLLAGGANLAGSVFGASTSASNTQANIAAQKEMLGMSEAYNTQEAATTEGYTQANMSMANTLNLQNSSTAYQRAAADMKAAGLNPAAMFGSAGAASTPTVGAPSGPQASVGVPSVSNVASSRTSPLAGLGDAMDKVVSTAIASKTFDRMTQEISNLQTQQALTAAQTKTEAQRPAQVAASTEQQKQEAFSTEIGSHIKELGLPGARFSAKSAEDLLSMPDWLRSSLNIGGYAGSKVSDVLAPILNSAKTGATLFKDRWP